VNPSNTLHTETASSQMLLTHETPTPVYFTQPLKPLRSAS